MTVDRTITTFDLLKTFAVIVMIIDHMGFYFMMPLIGAAGVGDPTLWLRAIGRWGLPVWFFLIGYGRSSSVPLMMIIGAIFLVAVNIATGMFIFPLNALASMIIIRLVLPKIMPFLSRRRESMLAGLLILFLGFVPTNEIFEYGTIGLLMGWMGYVVRAQRDRQPIGIFNDRLTLYIFLSLGLVAVLGSQYLSFRFDVFQMGVAMAGIIAVFGVLFFVRPTEYPRLTKITPILFRKIIQGCGRKTLEIYAIHLAAFKVIALCFGLGFPIYGWFEWDYTIFEAFANLS